MRIISLVFIFIFATLPYLQAQEKVLFFQTDWGNQLPLESFLERTRASGYDGIEVWFPTDTEKRKTLLTALERHGLKVIFLHGTNKSLPFKESLENYKQGLESALKHKPVLVNCHTGSDFFTFEENRAFIDAANTISSKYGIPVYHETHRGRFNYSLPVTNTYLSKIPDLKLTLDISHWMVVHESLLEGMQQQLAPVIARSHHIHARIGHAEGPQVNDPKAPEWKRALDRHVGIWEAVIKKGWQEHNGIFTVTTEFGPPDYMPTVPYTKMPLSDQWEANVFMMEAIKDRLKLKK